MSDASTSSPELLYVAYAMLSAAAYVAATVIMKYYGRVGLMQAAILIASCLVLAVFFETRALKTERLGMILLLILGSECALGLAMSRLWFKEIYNIKELLGFSLIIAGMALVKA